MVSLKSISVYVLAAAGLAAAAPAKSVPPRRCAAIEPPASFLAGLDELKLAEQGYDQGIAVATTVPVNFHVASSSQRSGQITDAVLARQFEVLRAAYAPYNIAFTFNGTDRIVDDRIATGLLDANGGRSSSQQRDFDAYVRRTRKGNYATLNIYFYTNFPANLFGLCYFPERTTAGSNIFWRDGCQVNGGTVPGGSIEDFNLGQTATHEVGHWFGLFHVFQGSSCSGSGDQVADTPAQSSPTSGCPASKDSCPNATGLDSIHNYMDYSTDIW